MMDEERANLWHGISATPNFVTTGGEHEVRNFKGMIVKTNTFYLRKCLREGLSETDMQQILEQRRKRHAFLQQHFGENRVVGESSDLRKVPLTQADCRLIDPDFAWPEQRHYVFGNTIILMQVFLPELENPDHHKIVSVGDGLHAEQRIKQLDKPYIRDTWSYLFNIQHNDSGTSPRSSIESEGVSHLRSDDVNNPVIQELALGCISYTERTGEILDLYGAFNCFIYDGRYHEQPGMKMVDTLWPTSSTLYPETRQLLNRLNNGETELSFQDRLNLLNGSNYIRFVNYLAAISDVQERLEIDCQQETWREDIPELLYNSNAAILSTLHNHSSSSQKSEPML